MDFCLETVEEALARHGKPEIFNTDQGSQFTSAAFSGLLAANGIAISMDGKGAWRDNVFVERLWRSVKYEEVYLTAYDSVGEARAWSGRYLDFYNRKRPHSNLGRPNAEPGLFPPPPPANHNRQRFHLTDADPCPDNPGQLYHAPHAAKKAPGFQLPRGTQKMTSMRFDSDASLSFERRPRLLDLPVGRGLSLGAREWGGQGIPCVLLHGIGEGAFVWDDFAREICDQWRVLAIDLPGHGTSSWLPSGKYSLDAHVAAVASALEALQLERLVLVGHSLGGDVAVRLVPRLGGALRGLALVDTGPETDAEAPVVVATQMRESQRSYETVAQYGDWLCAQRGMVRPDILRRHAEAALKPRAQGGFELCTDPALVGMLEVEPDDTWWNLALPQLRVPTLLVRGLGSSVLTAPLAKTMLSLLPNASLSVVGGAGHGVMSDNPEGFSDAILPFLTTLVEQMQKSPA